MTAHSLVVALEEAFAAARHMDTALAPRLRYIADAVRRLSPEFASAVDTFVSRLERSDAGAGAPRVGDPMPAFLLPDETGRLVGLNQLLVEGPVVVIFHRGHWCPYCRLNIAAVAEIQDEVRPAQLVTIAGERQAFTRMIKAEAGARFPLLTDAGNGYALSLNLAVWVDDTMSALIAAAGWDVPHFQGGDAWILPIPAVFVIDRDGIITARHVDPDYRRRMEPRDILRALTALQMPPSRHFAAG